MAVTERDGMQHSCRRERNSEGVLWSNALALPVVTYSFTIIKWSLTEIKRFDTKIHKLLTMHWMHHYKSDVNRLYLPRKEGGRKLVQLELFLRTSINEMDTCLSNTNEWILKLVEKHEQNKCLYSVTSDS